MNIVDIALLVIVGILAVLGLRRGFIMGLLDLLGIAAGLVIASLYYQQLIEPLTNLGLNRETAAIVAFVVLNIVALTIASAITGFIFQPLSRFPWPFLLRWGDSILGLIPGAIKGLALAAVIVLPLAFLQRPQIISDEVRASRFAEPLVGIGLDALYTAIDRYGINLADFAVITAQPETSFTQLPFTVTDGTRADEAAEMEMVTLVNRVRTEHGLNPLAIDPDLTAVSRAHSEEMFSLGYFAHTSKVTGNSVDRLNAAGARYVATGENLAYAPSVATAHLRLLASPDHYANIMNPNFTRIGIGAIRAEHRGLMITQTFAR
ncbi:MAG: CvpA family protein [Chloroflexota bacterium]|nr:CvpA family protein [Chloroflexota bacterium]